MLTPCFDQIYQIIIFRIDTVSDFLGSVKHDPGYGFPKKSQATKKPALPAFLSIHYLARLQNVNKQEQAQPYHVDEVPIPGDRFKGEVMIFAEMALRAAQPHYRKHDSS